MRNLKSFGQFLILLSGLLFFAGCQQESIVNPDDASIDERNSYTTAYPNLTFFGLGTANELYMYRSGPPATLLSNTVITGLRDGELMMAIDFRPATRVLYGVSNMNYIYTISTTTGFGSVPMGTATKVSDTPFSPGIEGTMVGFDFDPRADRIRIVTDKGQNIRIDPNTGQVVGIDLSVASQTVAINGIAYSYYSSGTFASTLYDLDILEGKLYKQNPMGGTLTLVGPTGLTISGEGGFDISSRGIAMATLLASGTPTFGTTANDETVTEAYRLYGISLRNGQATSLGKVRAMIGIALQ